MLHSCSTGYGKMQLFAAEYGRIQTVEVGGNSMNNRNNYYKSSDKILSVAPMLDWGSS